MAQPPGFSDPTKPSHVCRLRKALYGLKQAPRAWYTELRSFLLSTGFTNSVSDTSLFMLHGSYTLFVLVYVDDIIVTGSSISHVSSFIATLSSRFSLKDLGLLSYFLGVEVQPCSRGLFLNQHKYTTDLLARANLTDVKFVSTPMDATTKLRLLDSPLLENPTEYRALVGGLQYLSLTRPDIAFAVSKLSQFMHQPTRSHWTALKRLLRYLAGTISHGIMIFRDSPPSLHGYSDSDWAGNQDDFTSTGAYIIYLGRTPISWSSKKQRTVARSSTEAEYRSIANATAELTWLGHLLTELRVVLPSAPVVYCDNLGATNLSANPVFHSRMKHVALDYHFIREKVQSGSLRVVPIANDDQLADALTKPLPKPRFSMLMSKIGLSSRPSVLRGDVRV